MEGRPRISTVGRIPMDGENCRADKGQRHSMQSSGQRVKASCLFSPVCHLRLLSIIQNAVAGRGPGTQARPFIVWTAFSLGQLKLNLFCPICELQPVTTAYWEGELSQMWPVRGPQTVFRSLELNPVFLCSLSYFSAGHLQLILWLPGPNLSLLNHFSKASAFLWVKNGP